MSAATDGTWLPLIESAKSNVTGMKYKVRTMDLEREELDEWLPQYVDSVVLMDMNVAQSYCLSGIVHLGISTTKDRYNFSEDLCRCLKGPNLVETIFLHECGHAASYKGFYKNTRDKDLDDWLVMTHRYHNDVLSERLACVQVDPINGFRLVLLSEFLAWSFACKIAPKLCVKHSELISASMVSRFQRLSEVFPEHAEAFSKIYLETQDKIYAMMLQGLFCVGDPLPLRKIRFHILRARMNWESE